MDKLNSALRAIILSPTTWGGTALLLTLYEMNGELSRNPVLATATLTALIAVLLNKKDPPPPPDAPHAPRASDGNPPTTP